MDTLPFDPNEDINTSEHHVSGAGILKRNEAGYIRGVMDHLKRDKNKYYQGKCYVQIGNVLRSHVRPQAYLGTTIS